MSRDEFERCIPGVDPDVLTSLVNHLNSIIEHRESPLYVFFNPDLEKHAKAIGAEPRCIFQSFNFLCSHFSDLVKHHVIFQGDGIFYLLQEEDLKVLNEQNRFHNPDDPRNVYEDAKSLMRHAFVIGNVS